jgi:hypothetical protein
MSVVRLMTFRILLVPALVAACTQMNVSAPAPTQLTAGRAPREVVQRAAAVLIGQSFDITLSDAGAGVLTAKRERPATDPTKFVGIVCSFGNSGSVGAGIVRTTFTFSLSAQPHDSGSAIIIRGSVRAVLPSLSLDETDGSCVSDGTIEKAVADAIRD